MPDDENERYQIIQRHDSSWTGPCYLALDRETGRQVILKPLPGPCGKSGSQALPPPGLLGFSHPNVVGLMDVLDEEGVRYGVFEHAEATSLGEIARGQALDVALVRAIAVDCLDALAAGEALGLVHGDVQPETVVIVEVQGGWVRARLQEFAFTTMAEVDPAHWVIGDIHCMAPERLNGHPPDPSADLYALGVTLYYALTGRVAFPDTDIGRVEESHRGLPARPLAALRPDVPADFVAWIEWLMAGDRAARPTHAREALAALPAMEAADSGEEVLVPIPVVPADRRHLRVTTAGNRRGLLLRMLGIWLLGLAMGAGLVIGREAYLADRAKDLAARRAVAHDRRLASTPLAPILLPARDAVLQGSRGGHHLHIDPASGELCDWDRLEEFPAWAFTATRAGRFLVTLDYSLNAPPDSPGSVVELTVDQHRLRANLAAANPATQADLGELVIHQPGTLLLKLQPLAKSGTHVMNLRSLTLTWQGPE